MKLFESYRLKGLKLKNRIVMPPMCMYHATQDGFPTLFHLCHYATRALGGAGLIIVESTAVLPEGRISDHDLGIWNESQAHELKRLADACHEYGAKAALQISHAGRKSRLLSGKLYAPSAICYGKNYRIPYEMTQEDISHVVSAFGEAARRASEAGFDALEIHAAHGYLLHEFLSPKTNHRSDRYGGSLENRTRFLREVLEAVRKDWPVECPVLLRVSARDCYGCTDTSSEVLEIVNQVKSLIDLVHVSSGGLVLSEKKDDDAFQISLSARLREKCGLPTVAVGMFTDENAAEDILASGKADLVVIGRELLHNPNWPVDVAVRHNIPGYVPDGYGRAFVPLPLS
jgi:NADPH2 dehydrogenase